MFQKGLILCLHSFPKQDFAATVGKVATVGLKMMKNINHETRTKLFRNLVYVAF